MNSSRNIIFKSTVCFVLLQFIFYTFMQSAQASQATNIKNKIEANSPMQKLAVKIAETTNSNNLVVDINEVERVAKDLIDTKTQGIKFGKISSSLYYISVFDKINADVCGVGVVSGKAVVPLSDCRYEPIKKYESNAILIINKTTYNAVLQVARLIASEASVSLDEKERLTSIIKAGNLRKKIKGIEISTTPRGVKVTARGYNSVIISCEVNSIGGKVLVSGKTISGWECSKPIL